MTWLAFALISCCALCAGIEVNRRSKIDGYEVVLYRSIISGFLLIPFIPYMRWPMELSFYIMIALSALVYAYGNIVMSNLARRGGGRVAVMHFPILIVSSFVIWLIMTPAARVTIQHEPTQLVLTGLCFVVLCLSLHFVRRNDYAWKALLAVLPVALGYGTLNVLQKWFLVEDGGGLGMILAILLLGNFGMVVALPMLARFRVKSDELSITHHVVFPIIPLGAIALLHMVSWGCMLHALELAPNPAYPAAVTALSPVLFQVYYWIRGWRDNASPMAGTALSLSAVALAFVNM